MSPDRLHNLTISLSMIITTSEGMWATSLVIWVPRSRRRRVPIEALETIKTHRPNLVLSDISMPGRDGFGCLVTFVLSAHRPEVMCRLLR